jgi:hypothetical protein
MGDYNKVYKTVWQLVIIMLIFFSNAEGSIILMGLLNGLIQKVKKGYEKYGLFSTAKYQVHIFIFIFINSLFGFIFQQVRW